MSDELVESGATVFAPPPSPTYRYVISCKADQLSISLEDQKSKQQWATGYLTEDSYLTSTNRIGNAALIDYVSIFKEALDYLVTTDRKSDLNTKKTRRNLILMDGGLQLEFSVKIKLQEVEGELAAARACLQKARVVFLEGSTGNVDGRLQWKPTERNDFEVTDDGSAIRFLVVGWYVISLVMFLAPQPAGAYIEFLINGEDFDSGEIIPFNGDRDVSACIGSSIRFDKDDKLSFIAVDYQRSVGAGITITKIGN
ncbi:hypothetical protein PF010_g26815 [Phytophthora fragariae]|uniref:Uncharacterized protein n=2 Tax=Phytophthora fragariae TaxID=53985 RepID=A0A6A3DGC1_9STRA|nr:hypothetical protein PF009_g32190 [Phytophthora fragariae]KAE9069035.1 hypothetical protein PF010_g26815 [Phytophthora fragariae]KAE9170012.1 hypothetical protein PF004_g28009 [Phytophthora fragariae]KAE9201240.1 hypothetical protein PF002_g21599 [Phytophthora fragariae]